ncbi:hypothetical protein PYW07_012664 [Mythimna separata]|uniref:C2H2-type domain-containing protein n=1 Tax=Mythimna separata TaxID=271217 RepID=A0AAD7Y8U7_MYTSE|nr:hypothetical protein PYW07_012664 [Mythimna separata]
MGLKNFNGKLWLCMWCKAALRHAMALFTLALESEKTLHSKVPTDIPTKSKRIYSLNITNNSHIDIPPLLIEYQDYKTENIIDEEEIINPLLEIQDDEIPFKRMKTIDSVNKESSSKNESCSNKESSSIKESSLNKESSSIKESSLNKESSSNTITISNKEHETFENEFDTKKRNKKEFDFNELKFEVQYLNLEEQLREIELKKLKYKDFNFQCDECGLGFLTGDVFEEHKIRHTELSGPHKCSICALHFKSPDVLSQHTLAHKRRFKCILCSTVFSRWSRCVGHRYQCGGTVEPRACGDCGKLFSNEYSLKIHMKVHKSEKKYCCEQCDRRFSSKHRLTVHMRSHSGIKPFSCTQCARTFSTRSNLRAHSSVHDSTMQFYCVECHTYYKTAKSLKRHFNESAKHVGFTSDM